MPVANKQGMQLRLIAVGKLREPYTAQACAEFAKRLSPYYPLEIVEVRAASGTRPADAMRDEGERLLQMLSAGDEVWLLDRTGEEFSSEDLAQKLDRVAHEGSRRLVVIVGGTYGVSSAVLQRATLRWSLSKLTFLHEWARMIALEQLYRAAKIIRNEPYHH